MFSQSQAAFPTDHLRRRQQNRRPAPAHCAQISLSVTLDKIEKDQRRPSRQQPETIRNISWLARSPGKGAGGHRPGAPPWVSHISAIPKYKNRVGLSHRKKIRDLPFKGWSSRCERQFPQGTRCLFCCFLHSFTRLLPVCAILSSLSSDWERSFRSLSIPVA